jgi:hypothetical protein
MVQVPVVSIVADVPDTVQTRGVVEANMTAKLEVAVAESVSGVPTFWVPGLVKVMVCASPLTVKLCGTIVAAA